MDFRKKIEETKSEIHLNRRNEIEAFISALKSSFSREATPKDEELFQSFIMLAIDEYGVPRRKLAESIEVDPAQITRWCKGQAAPKPIIRPMILEILAALLEERLDSIFPKHEGLSPTD